MAKKKKKEYNQGIVTLDNSGNVTTVQKSQDYKTNYAPKREVNKPSVGSTIKGSIKKAANTLGTGAELVLKGATKSIENTLDTANNLATKANTGMESLLLGLAGKDKKGIKKLTDAEKKANREYIKRDITNELEESTGLKKARENMEKSSFITESNLGGQIAQGVGGMVPSLLAGQYFGGVSAPGQSLKGLKGIELAKTAAKNVGTNLMNNAAANAVLGASSYGSGVEEAYQQGATDKQANLYGLGNAALEFGTEMLTGGIPGLENQTGIVDNLVEKGVNKLTSGIKGQIPKAIAKGGLKVASNMLGEGFEEGLSTLLNPTLKNATYADGEKVNWEEVGRSALVGGLTGAFLSGPQDLMTMSNEIRQARQQQLQEVQNQVQSGEITPEQGTQKLEQIEKGTYKENQQLNQIAQRKVEEIQQEVQNGNISNQEAIKEIEAVSQTLSQQREQLNNNLNTQEQQEYNDLQNLPFELEGQELKRLNQLEAKKNNTELYQTINNRENVDLSDRNVKAIQQEHPEVKPFYQDVASDLLTELDEMGVKSSATYKESEYGPNTVERNKRYIPDSDLREYADRNNITIEKLKDGLSRIIEDNGKENTKVAKEVEQILDKKLQDGYTSLREGKIPPNQDYIDLVSGKVKPNELLNADMESNADEGIVANEEGKVKGENERPYVLKEVPEKQKTPLKERIVEAIDKTYRSVVDKGQTIYKIAKETGNSTLYHKYDRLGTTPSEAQSQIGFAQTDLNGKKYNNFIDKNGKNVSMSVDSIWKDANNVGISDNVLGEYLVNQLNIDRINQGVEQFANLTEGESLDTIRQLEEEYPEIKRVAQNVWTYQQNQLQKMVDAGLISEDVANSFKEQTPHYVRIQRDVGNLKNNNGLKFKNGKVEVNNQIQDIKGGNLDILPLKETMAQYTQDVTQAIRKNIFGQELLNSMSVNSTDSNASIFDANDDSFGINPDILSNDGKGNYSLTIFKDGMATVVPIDSGIYESLNTNKSAFEKNIDMLGTPLRKLSGLQRTLLTDKNPIFMATNMLKDIGDAPLNSKYGMGKFYKTYAELFGNRTVGNATGKNKFKSYVELYESLGGSQNSYFSDGNFNKESKNIAKKGLSKGIELIEKGNEFIESMPRITEFVNTIKENGYTVDSDGGLIPTKGKKQTKSVDQVLNEAMYNAAEITTNFKRGGDIAKTLNRNGATFLNASIQGFDKQIRNFTERVNNPKQMVGLLAKVAALGVAPALLNNAMYDDDDEYNELQDYIKDEYYLLKDKDGKFIRIPKGRVMSIFGGAARRTYKAFNGDKDAFKGFGKEVADQVAPNSPIDNNIIAPFYAVKNNKSWSGNQIESDYLQSLPEGERADAKTTSLAKKLGELTGYSPKKIDYLIDQYTGGIGDVVQPMMTNYAEDEKDSGMSALTNPFKSKFTTDSTNNQKTVSNYYELKKKIEQNSNSSKATDLDKIKYMYINKYSDVQSELSGLYAKQRDVQNSTELSNSEKYKQNKEVQKEINAKIKKTTEALNNAQKISKNVYKIGNEYYYDTIDDNGNQKWKKASAKEEKTRGYSGMSVSDYYREVKQKKIDSQTKSNETTNKLNDFLTSNKIDNDKYEEWSYHLGKLESDKDSNGKTINGSLKKKRIEYINSLPISNEQKQALYNYKYNKK